MPEKENKEFPEKRQNSQKEIENNRELSERFAELRFDIYRIFDLVKLLNFLYELVIIDDIYPNENCKDGKRFICSLNQMIAKIVKANDMELEMIDGYLSKNYSNSI